MDVPVKITKDELAYYSYSQMLADNVHSELADWRTCIIGMSDYRCMT